MSRVIIEHSRNEKFNRHEVCFCIDSDCVSVYITDQELVKGGVGLLLDRLEDALQNIQEYQERGGG